MKKTSKGQIGSLATKLVAVLMTLIDEKNQAFLDEFDGGKVQDAIDRQDTEEMRKVLMELVNNNFRLQKLFANTFVLGKVFKGRATAGDTRLYFWESFEEKFIQNNLDRQIAIRTDLGKLSQYRLPKNMRDKAIQGACKDPHSMDFDTFMCVVYLLIFEKETANECFGMELSKNEYYIFHIKMDDGTALAVRLCWHGDAWDFDVYTFDEQLAWGGGRCVVYFPATAKK